MRPFLIAAIALSVLPVALTPAQADPYKWCAVYDGDMGGATNCGFVTLDQCRATVSGIGGFCAPNNFYTGPSEPPARRVRKARKSDNPAH